MCVCEREREEIYVRKERELLHEERCDREEGDVIYERDETWVREKRELT